MGEAILFGEPKAGGRNTLGGGTFKLPTAAAARGGPEEENC